MHLLRGKNASIIPARINDNAGITNQAMKMNKDSLLKMSTDRGFVSTVRERTEEDYHTRFGYSNNGARGIDHIMANEKGCDLYLAGRIDQITTAVLFPSTDHARVQCDLRLGFNNNSKIT